MSMWGRRGPDQSAGAEKADPLPRRAPVTPQPPPREADAPVAQPRSERTAEPRAQQNSVIGKTVKFRGTIDSQEDIDVHGLIEGKISIPKNRLLIGTNGEVHAEIEARSLLLRGTLHGKVNVHERIEIKKEGRLEGNLISKRLVVEDGAVFCGTSEVKGRDGDPVVSRAASAETPAAASATKAAKPAPSGPALVRPAKA